MSRKLNQFLRMKIREKPSYASNRGKEKELLLKMLFSLTNNIIYLLTPSQLSLSYQTHRRDMRNTLKVGAQRHRLIQTQAET